MSFANFELIREIEKSILTFLNITYLLTKLIILSNITILLDITIRLKKLYIKR